MEKVTKSFWVESQKVEVLRGISLELRPGDFVAIVGASGSGKTTLMNLIGCLDVPTSGRYYLAENEVSRMTDDQLSTVRNEHIGFVFQSFYLIPYATALENVLLPALYSHDHKDDAMSRATRLLEMVGLKERAHFKPNRLSGGEQQRVAIARALINQPEIILADEPTGQLDSKTAAEIMKIMTGLNEDGKTIVLVTHDMDTASYARSRIRIKDGLITESEEP